MGNVYSFKAKKKRIDNGNIRELDRINRILSEIDTEAVARFICKIPDEEGNIDNTIYINHAREEFEKWSAAMNEMAKFKLDPEHAIHKNATSK